MTLFFEALGPMTLAGRPAPLGALQFVGYSSVSGNSTTLNLPTTGLTGGVGSSVQIGDLCIVGSIIPHTSDLDPGVTDTTFTWTEVADLYANDTHDANMSVAWARATVAAPANITVTGPSTASFSSGAILLVFRNQDETVPMDATPTTATGINDTTPDPPAITSVTQGAAIVTFGCAAYSDTATFQITGVPAGYTATVNLANTAGTSRDSTISAAYLMNQAPGTYNPGTFTTGGTDVDSSWAAVTLAIRPST